MESNKLTPGASVIFILKDATCPDLAGLLGAIGSELQVAGSIVYFSDGCDQQNQFAVVEVAGIHTPVIVPVERLDSIARWVERQPWTLVEKPSREAC